MISGVAGLIFTRERTSTPLPSSSAISLISASGESTTPLPIRHRASSRRMPEGIRCSTVFLPLITSVWPALWPPWKRATALTRSVSRSTILPLPSSPHWAPRMTTDLPMKVLARWVLPREPRMWETGKASAHQLQDGEPRDDRHRTEHAQRARLELQRLAHHRLPVARGGEQHQALEHKHQAQRDGELVRHRLQRLAALSSK